MKRNPYLEGLFETARGRRSTDDAEDLEAARGDAPSRWEMELEGYDTNELGRSQRVGVLTATSGTAGFKELARVKVDPRAARDWTITLGPLSPGSSFGPFQQQVSGYAPPNISDAVAIVEWSGGQQGAPNWAIVDYWAGQQFSVFGSAVRVSAAVVVLATAVVAANNTHVLTASIAPGLSRNQPRRTIIYPANIASSGGSFAAAVPPYAKSLSLSLANATDFGASDLVLSGELINGGTKIWDQFVGIGGAGIGGQSEFAATRLPIGTNFVRITNNDNNTDVFQARILYDLALS